MKKTILNILIAVVFLTGLGVLVYPTVSNQWNTYRQSQLISDYQAAVTDMSEEDYSQEWSEAEAFTYEIKANNIYGDVFGEESEDSSDSAYRQILNIGDDGVMGYLDIPKINIRLSIYHGTSDEVLQTGVGHLNGTSLPIGGESTHSVLAGHRGLPSALIFTNIDQLEEGDVFYIHVLDQVLAYQVDQILDMVDKDDTETLSSALAIEEGKDYVTLFTCTPYGVNTHRLLVRGERIPYDPEVIEEDTTPASAVVENIQDYYMLYLIAGLIIVLIVALILGFVFRKNKKKGKKEDS